MALSCPVKGLQVDERTLAIIDADGDGHVRPPDIIAAVSWACARLRDPAMLLEGAEILPLAAIGDNPEGRAVSDAASWILSALGKPAAVAVSATDAAEVSKSVAKGPLKGDGILRPEAAPDEETRALIGDIASCLKEVTESSVASFYSDLEAFKAWHAAGGAATAAGIGPAAAEAFQAVAAVRAKVVDYFTRTQLASFDPSAVPGLNRDEEAYRALSGADLAADSPVLAALPLARIEAGRPLPLLERVNPPGRAPWPGFTTPQSFPFSEPASPRSRPRTGPPLGRSCAPTRHGSGQGQRLPSRVWASSAPRPSWSARAEGRWRTFSPRISCWRRESPRPLMSSASPSSTGTWGRS